MNDLELMDTFTNQTPTPTVINNMTGVFNRNMVKLDGYIPSLNKLGDLVDAINAILGEE